MNQRDFLSRQHSFVRIHFWFSGLRPKKAVLSLRIPRYEEFLVILLKSVCKHVFNSSARLSLQISFQTPQNVVFVVFWNNYKDVIRWCSKISRELFWMDFLPSLKWKRPSSKGTDTTNHRRAWLLDWVPTEVLLDFFFFFGSEQTRMTVHVPRSPENLKVWGFHRFCQRLYVMLLLCVNYIHYYSVIGLTMFNLKYLTSSGLKTLYWKKKTIRIILVVGRDVHTVSLAHLTEIKAPETVIKYTVKNLLFD